MRQSLQLRLGQQLTMTPQLQQAIRLLQLSTLDLQTEIQSALDSNLMLEPVEDIDYGASRDEQSVESERPSREDGEAAGGDEGDAGVETDWEALSSYDYEASGSYSQPDDDDRDPYGQRTDSQDSLREYLVWQMELTPFSDQDRLVAAALIDAIDDTGYLSAALSEIHLGLLNQGLVGLEEDEVEAVLHRIQRFDPPGVGARGPAECLALQLDQLPADTPWRDQARELVTQHLDLLAGRDFNALQRRLKVDREDLADIIGLIQSLNPHPGTQLSAETTQYVVPDVFVTRTRGIWRVALNAESTPRIRINSQYARLIRRADSSADNTYLRNQLQEARWFLKSLHNRNETLLRVATCIVEQQREFLEHGEERMKPLVLRDIADALSMHESTISRVTTQKYMHTPRGIYEFKYFFSSHVGTSDGGECSSVAIRAMIRKLIMGENPRKPLSDSQIAQTLDKEGINVARRTVAKYREAMAIPASSERKRLS